MHNKTCSKSIDGWRNIYENQRMTSIDIYINISNTNNYTTWHSNDHLLTFISVTLDTSQDDILLLNSDTDTNMP